MLLAPLLRHFGPGANGNSQGQIMGSLTRNFVYGPPCHGRHRRKGCSPSAAPQPSSGLDLSGRDGCGIDQGDGGAEPRATGVLARSLAGPSHCAHSRQLCRSSCAARVAHICENCDVPSPCMSSERAKSCHVRCADERLSVGDGKGAPQMNVERGRAACWPSLEPRSARFSTTRWWAMPPDTYAS